MKSLLLMAAFALSTQAMAVDNSDCPTGRKGQAKATKANFLSVMEKGTEWHNPGYQGTRDIVMVDNAVFKLGYKGQAKKKKREILIENDIGNTMFSGALLIAGKLRVELDQIYFTIHNGLCTLVTKTNPDEYHPSTVNYPYSDMKHHKIQNDKGDFVKIPFGGTVHVLRKYYWSRSE